ncbi:hypothetical protein BDF21DRAFT_466145 [Thamnidium elegans]|uniref:Uncharacterized protein n=1 Tax=Thamnidium elegans TaxID=101142 RepID=A0A8H7VXZ4_9FUNG|nr:hypothetical protein INT48_008486 [Thamnidium elegans]KAI8067405.1 hypothetical protein BDF21DRAFT_466145 [Thamnidium elegans]
MNTQFNGKGWRSTNRQLDGLSQPLTRKLEDMDPKELSELYEKTSIMLNNPGLKLPDGGAKLRHKLAQIQSIMNNENTIANGITEKVSGLSLNEKLDVRRETVLRSNNVQEVHAHNLLRAHDADEQHTRTARMMSLEESMKLQELQQNNIKLANMRKKMESVRGSVAAESLADDLSLTMNRLRLDPETRIPRPDDDGPSDEEGDDADSDDSDPMNYERYEDEAYDDEEDDEEFDDGQLHNNNNRRV